MCRWLAYTGAPVLLSRVLYPPVHSMIGLSLRSRLGAETTNGDGFGVGLYDTAPVPGVCRSTEPAWNDQNLCELTGHVSLPLLFTYVRAAIGSPVQQTNCHPFRHGRWLSCTTGTSTGNLPGAWVEMPEASYGVVSKGDEQLLPFVPEHPGRDEVHQ